MTKARSIAGSFSTAKDTPANTVQLGDSSLTRLAFPGVGFDTYNAVNQGYLKWDAAQGHLVFDNTTSRNAVDVYTTQDSLPFSGIAEGRMAFVESDQRLYLYNGSGYYTITLISADISPISNFQTSYSLDATYASDLVITLVATDSNGAPVTFNHSVTGGSLSPTASVTNNGGGEFVISPADSAGAEGTFDLTFTAGNGTGNTSIATVAFSLSFAKEAYFYTPDESKMGILDYRMSADGNTMWALRSVVGDGKLIRPTRLYTNAYGSNPAQWSYDWPVIQKYDTSTSNFQIVWQYVLDNDESKGYGGSIDNYKIEVDETNNRLYVFVTAWEDELSSADNYDCPMIIVLNASTGALIKTYMFRYNNRYGADWIATHINSNGTVYGLVAYDGSSSTWAKAWTSIVSVDKDGINYAKTWTHQDFTTVDGIIDSDGVAYFSGYKFSSSGAPNYDLSYASRLCRFDGTYKSVKYINAVSGSGDRGYRAVAAGLLEYDNSIIMPLKDMASEVTYLYKAEKSSSLSFVNRYGYNYGFGNFNPVSLWKTSDGKGNLLVYDISASNRIVHMQWSDSDFTTRESKGIISISQQPASISLTNSHSKLGTSSLQAYTVSPSIVSQFNTTYFTSDTTYPLLIKGIKDSSGSISNDWTSYWSDYSQVFYNNYSDLSGSLVTNSTSDISDETSRSTTVTSWNDALVGVNGSPGYWRLNTVSNLDSGQDVISLGPDSMSGIGFDVPSLTITTDSDQQVNILIANDSIGNVTLSYELTNYDSEANVSIDSSVLTISPISNGTFNILVTGETGIVEYRKSLGVTVNLP